VREEDIHIGMYAKCVIPTGTEIDTLYLRNVFSPICGNGHFVELGIGASAHVTPFLCDDYSFGFYCDGYITAMFESAQTRTFDIFGQPMSRYALVYQFDSSFSNNTIVSVGDVNYANCNISGMRGECILEGLYQSRCLKLAVGYAFAGQSAESISPAEFVTQVPHQYAFVGNAPQNMFGIGGIQNSTLNQPISDQNAVINTALTGADPYTIPLNFYNLGPTNLAAMIPEGQSAAYSYGEPTGASLCQFTLPQCLVDGYNLMSTQYLNRIYTKITYVWSESIWEPEVSVVGSYGTVPSGYITAAYWDVGFRLAGSF
jgi:hypothetical protein